MGYLAAVKGYEEVVEMLRQHGGQAKTTTDATIHDAANVGRLRESQGAAQRQS